MKFYMIISLILELRKPRYPADFYRKLALKIHEKFEVELLNKQGNK